MSDDTARSLPLKHRHEKLGARMASFAGYSMPMQYLGIKQEHHAVRNGVGIFDVSHMGEIEFRGPDAVAAVDRLVTNDASQLVDGQAMYTALCNEDGGIVDDLVVYRLTHEHLMICVNASNREKDFAHMQRYTDGDVTVENTSDDWVQLAVQGPHAQVVLDPLTDVELSDVEYYNGAWMNVAGCRCFVSRTGYTGEDGFEIYIPVEHGEPVFDAIMLQGEPQHLQPCGLGARDTLRLEARYLLYGNDMTEQTNPVEAGLNWVVKLDKSSDFVGKEALCKIKAAGPSRRMRGFILKEPGVLRPGYAIFVGDEKVGELTSGGYAPTLEKSIGLGLIAVDYANEELVDVEIRGRRLRAELTKKPFYKRH